MFMAFSAPSRTNTGSASSDAPTLATIACSSVGAARCQHVVDHLVAVARVADADAQPARSRRRNA